jgi:YD repeat-containing protein
VTVNRAHDSSNRVTTLKDSTSTTMATYSYDILDRATGMTLANSTSVTWSYDLINRITSVDNALATGNRTYSYVYDNDSRVTQTTEPRGVIATSYSDRSELTGIVEPSGSPFADGSENAVEYLPTDTWTYYLGLGARPGLERFGMPEGS